MKWQTPCEIAYVEIVPYIRSALVKKLLQKGVSVRRACKEVGLSVTAFEKHRYDKKVEILEENEDVNDMLDAIANRIYSGDRIEPMTFCIICSQSRKVLGLGPCYFS